MPDAQEANRMRNRWNAQCALNAACERLISYIDERKKWGPLMLERRRREGNPPLDTMRDWPEHVGWQNAIANEGIAHEDIRRALAALKANEEPAHA